MIISLLLLETRMQVNILNSQNQQFFKTLGGEGSIRRDPQIKNKLNHRFKKIRLINKQSIKNPPSPSNVPCH